MKRNITIFDYETHLDFFINGPIDEVIEWTKKNLDINASNEGYFYNLRKKLIKERLDREGLSYDIVKPD